jgi:hypothetical protein
MRISNTAQLQKWQYLHSLAHLGHGTPHTVTALLRGAIDATASDPSYFCTSLVEWGAKMCLTLHQAKSEPFPPPLQQFFTQASQRPISKVYTDGSFTIDAPLLESLALPAHELTSRYSKSATGVYLPPVGDMNALALLLDTPRTQATNAYYIKNYLASQCQCCSHNMYLSLPSPTAHPQSRGPTKHSLRWVPRLNISSMAHYSLASELSLHPNNPCPP